MRRQLGAAEGQALRKLAMTPQADDGHVRDEILVAATSLTSERLKSLGEPARHRAALALLRAWGLERRWRTMYGSPRRVETRLRELLGAALCEHTRRPIAPAVVELANANQARALRPQRATNQLAVRTAVPARSLSDSAARQLVSPARALSELVERQLAPLRARSLSDSAARQLVPPARALSELVERQLAPLRQVGAQITAWLERLLAPAREAFQRWVNGPAVRAAADLLKNRALRGLGEQPVQLLLRTHRDRLEELMRSFAGRAKTVPRSSMAPPPAEVVDAPEAVELVLPDEQMLVAFFGGERGDPAWRRGPGGWLLTALPLHLGDRVHALFCDSSEAALAWLSERLLRREIRRHIEPALIASGCDQTTGEVILAGLEFYLQRGWAPADTLLTAGLEGLILDLAASRDVVTEEGRRLRRPDGRTGRKITTAADTRLLNALGFNGSEIQYLTTLSLGPTGNPPRHGAASPLGSDRHAAGSLLGILLVLAHLGGERTVIARALLEP